MKKRLVYFLAFVMVLTLTACNSGNIPDNNTAPLAKPSTISAKDNPTGTKKLPPSVSDMPKPMTDLKLPLVAVEDTCDALARYITKDNVYHFEMYKDGRDKVIDNVRSFVYNTEASNFYIKTDNTLWGWGSNSEGLLGDGTGVDRDEPVKILDDVAAATGMNYRMYAIKSDKSLWVWGGGIYEPEMLATDVVKIIGPRSTDIQPSASVLVLTSSGYLANINIETKQIEALPEGFPSEAIYDIQYAADASGIISWLDESKSLWCYSKRNAEKVLVQDGGVEKFKRLFMNRFYIFFTKSDGSLWGFGDNKDGELGDGTKAPRTDAPVKIADHVAEGFLYTYLTEDGELWAWDSEAPTPEKLLGDVASYREPLYGGLKRIAFLNNGDCVRIYYDRNEVVFSNIKIPDTLIFE